MSKYYKFTPKPDITAWELARILPLIYSPSEAVFPDGIPADLKRHLVEIESSPIVAKRSPLQAVLKRFWK